MAIRGLQTYGFHIDENAPLTITVSKNGEKISHGYDYRGNAPKPIAKELNSLAAEARKYKSAEEFVKAEFNKNLRMGCLIDQVGKESYAIA